MATDFNINDFIGGGSASNFGNFGDTSTPADLFSPSSAPSQPFAFDAFEGASFNSPQVNASLFGFQGSPSSTQSILGPGVVTEQDAMRINSFLTSNQNQPIVSSTPGAGLEAFNRFNPTTRQFEQLFGNQKAIEQFDDSQKFLQSIRDEAQRNATNFLGQTVTNEQLAQAEELGALMGTTPEFTADSNQVLQTANYGQASAPVSAEDLNKLLNMRTNRQQDLQRTADNQIVRGEDFQKAMAEMNQPFIESRAAFDQASDLQQEAIKNRIPFGATFNYDDQGNKVLAGASARAAGQGPDITQAEARAIAEGRGLRATPAQKARGFLTENKVAKRQQEKQLTEQAEAVKGFLSQYNDSKTGKPLGSELGIDGIREGIKAVGSPQEFVRMYGRLQADLSPSEKTKLDSSIAGAGVLAATGTPLEGQGLFKEKGSNKTYLLGYDQSDGPNAGKLGFVDRAGNFIIADPTKFRGVSDSEIPATRKTALELRGSAFESYRGIKQMEDFIAERGASASGFDLIVTEMKTALKNLANKPLNAKEFATILANANFEALLGTIRLDVLGPGVLTEQDAMRLISAMGGFGGTTDKEASMELVRRLIERRRNKVGDQLSLYNATRTAFESLEKELPEITINNIEQFAPEYNRTAFDPNSLIKPVN